MRRYLHGLRQTRDEGMALACGNNGWCVVREDMASAGCHGPARWESWDVVVRELLRLQAQAKQDLAYFK